MIKVIGFLLGIRDKYRKIIRPMLSIYKKEIISYSIHNNLFWMMIQQTMITHLEEIKLEI